MLPRADTPSDDEEVDGRTVAYDTGRHHWTIALWDNEVVDASFDDDSVLPRRAATGDGAPYPATCGKSGFLLRTWGAGAEFKDIVFTDDST